MSHFLLRIVEIKMECGQYIPFKPFHVDLPDDSSGCSFLLLGSTRSGKSTLQNYIYYRYFSSHICCVHTFSPQARIYTGIKKGTVFCEDYEPKLIEATYEINKKTKNHYKFAHFIDDVVGKRQDPTLIKLLTVMRNSRISALITGQELSIFNNIARSNINFVCLMFLNSDAAIKKAVESYLRTYFPSDMSITDCMKAYKEMTADHHFIFINNLTGEVYRTKLSMKQ
ncbi:MAG: hypothetical protein EBU90_21770 [Proteobacteria bacterium]|nr:hypothetical protein [Pseudomonadota bacterium]